MPARWERDGAGHAFLNDTRAIRYRDQQTHELWADVKAFFGKHLG